MGHLFLRVGTEKTRGIKTHVLKTTGAVYPTFKLKS